MSSHNLGYFSAMQVPYFMGGHHWEKFAIGLLTQTVVVHLLNASDE
jgi:hypothetical protein